MIQTDGPEHNDDPSVLQGLTRGQQNRGMKQIYFAASAGSLYTVLIAMSAVGALFVKKLGGSDFQAMLLGSVMFIGRAVQIPISMRVAPENGKRFLVRTWHASSLLFLMGLVFPAFTGPGPAAVWVFLAFSIFAVLMSNLGATFWFPLLHDIVPIPRRGRFFGRLRATWNGVGLIVILLAGVFLGEQPEIWRFQVVLGIGLIGYAARTWITGHMPEGHSLSGKLDYPEWRHYVRGLLRQKHLMLFLAYYIVLGFCIGILNQPLVLYMQQRGFSASDNVILFSTRNMGMVMSFLVAGELVDRLGTKRIFTVAHLVLCAVCFMVVGIGYLPDEPAKFALPAVLVLAGMMHAAASVGSTAQLFDLIPNRGRAFYLSLSLAVVFAGPALSPLLMGALFDRFNPTQPIVMNLNVFQVSLAAAGSLLVLSLWLLLIVKNVRTDRPSGLAQSESRLG